MERLYSVKMKENLLEIFFFSFKGCNEKWANEKQMLVGKYANLLYYVRALSIRRRRFTMSSEWEHTFYVWHRLLTSGTREDLGLSFADRTKNVYNFKKGIYGRKLEWRGLTPYGLKIQFYDSLKSTWVCKIKFVNILIIWTVLNHFKTYKSLSVEKCLLFMVNWVPSMQRMWNGLYLSSISMVYPPIAFT